MASAEQEPDRREKLVARAARHAGALEEIGVPWATALGTLTRAGCAGAVEDHRGAVQLLGVAIKELDVAGMGLFAFHEVLPIRLVKGLEFGILGRKQTAQTGCLHHQVSDHALLWAPVLLGVGLEVSPQIGFR